MKIVILGDIMLDVYINGISERISPEAPVPVVLETDIKNVLGGAGNVYNNLIGLGAEVLLFGVVGNDGNGDVINHLIQKTGNTSLGLIYKNKPTITKTRIVVNGHQIARVDKEEKYSLNSEDIFSIQRKIKDFNPDAIIVSDYNKGFISKELVNSIRDFNCLKVADPKKDLTLFNNFDLITPNEKEYVYTPESFQKIGVHYILQTLGAKGMRLIGEDYDLKIETIGKDVYDVTGAGDTVVATYTFFKCKGEKPHNCAYLANAAAGIVVSRRGTSSINIDDLKEYINPLNNIKNVKKVWGNELWFANSKLYCGKILNLSQGFKCSYHYHAIKDETFYVLSGKVLMIVNDKTIIMEKGNSIKLKPYDKHSFAGILPSIILEVSTQHFDSDSYRETKSEEWSDYEKHI